MPSPQPISELSYKEASIELERIVRSLESGDLELEEALESYERASQLLTALRERLATAEQKVSVLMAAAEAPVQGQASELSAPKTAFMEE